MPLPGSIVTMVSSDNGLPGSARIMAKIKIGARWFSGSHCFPFAVLTRALYRKYRTAFCLLVTPPNTILFFCNSKLLAIPVRTHHQKIITWFCLVTPTHPYQNKGETEQNYSNNFYPLKLHISKYHLQHI
jgi:hypothetical protein